MCRKIECLVLRDAPPDVLRVLASSLAGSCLPQLRSLRLVFTSCHVALQSFVHDDGVNAEQFEILGERDLLNEGVIDRTAVNKGAGGIVRSSEDDCDELQKAQLLSYVKCVVNESRNNVPNRARQPQSQRPKAPWVPDTQERPRAVASDGRAWGCPVRNFMSQRSRVVA